MRGRVVKIVFRPPRSRLLNVRVALDFRPIRNSPRSQVLNFRPLIRGRRPRCRCGCYVYRSCLSRDKCPGMLGTSSCISRRSCAKDCRPLRYCTSWVGPAYIFIAMQWDSYIAESHVKECFSISISYY